METYTLQAAHTRLARVLESLSQREVEVEHLRERVYQLAGQLYAAENILVNVQDLVPAHHANSIKEYFQYHD